MAQILAGLKLNLRMSFSVRNPEPGLVRVKRRKSNPEHLKLCARSAPTLDLEIAQKKFKSRLGIDVGLPRLPRIQTVMLEGQQEYQRLGASNILAVRAEDGGHLGL